MSAPTTAQGDPQLLDTEVAQRLLVANLPARLAYTAIDGPPRVLPINFHWTGEELVMGTFAPSSKARALRRRPDVAITIDTVNQRPEVLLLRGQASVTDVDGIVPEYELPMRRGMDARQADAYFGHLASLALRMERIALRPTWVGVLDSGRAFRRGCPTRWTDRPPCAPGGQPRGTEVAWGGRTFHVMGRIDGTD